MAKLTDEEIQVNYEIQGRNTIERYEGGGETVDCNRCGRHDETSGAGQSALARVPNQSTHLPRFIQLCDDCAIALRFINEE
jgi:hypothetical protein